MRQTISIIIPVHNADRTLEAAVLSAACQSIRRQRPEILLELILVDDGSTDQSGRRCDSYAGWYADPGLGGRSDEEPGFGSDPLADGKPGSSAAEGRPFGILQIKVIHMEDEGVSEARNRGMEAARGDFLTFLDADDAMEESMLEQLLTLYEKSGAAICGCGFCSVAQEEAADYAEKLLRACRKEGENGSDAGEEPETSRESQSPEKRRTAEATEAAAMLAGREIFRDGILQGDTRVWSKLFSRELIGGVRFRKGLTIGEDMLFVTELIRQDTSYAYLADPLYRYTRNPQGAMERPFTVSYMDQMRCYEEAERVIQERAPELLQDGTARKRLRRLQIIADVLTASKMARLRRTEFLQYKEEFAVCRRALREHMREPGIASVIPPDYRLKSFMLRYLPAGFCLMMKAAAAGKRR